jgi:hypothetical protein
MSDIRQRVRETLDRMRDVAALSASATVIACSGSSVAIDPGYGVVDPMPSPARCDEPFAGRIWPNAVWHQKNGRFVLTIDVDLQWALAPSGTVSATPRVEGGKLGSMPQTPTRKLTVDLIPDAGATEMLVTIPLSCPPTTADAKFKFDLKGPVADGQSASGELVPDVTPMVPG